MRGRRRAGFTLMELAIYAFLSVLLMAMVYSMYVSLQRYSTRTQGSYLLTREVEQAVRWLQRDLGTTSLSTVRVFPAGDLSTPTQRPGLSLESPYGFEQPGELQVDPHAGTPRWDKFVFYTLEPGSDGWTGDLVRWESRPSDTLQVGGVEILDPRRWGLPQPAHLNAGLYPDSPESLRRNSRVVLRGVLLPLSLRAKKAPIVFQEGTARAWTLGQDDGGFQVRFVRTDGTLSSVPPGANDQWSTNTRLVEVRLAVLTDPGTSRKDYYELRFRVTPWN